MALNTDPNRGKFGFEPDPNLFRRPDQSPEGQVTPAVEGGALQTPVHENETNPDENLVLSSPVGEREATIVEPTIDEEVLDKPSEVQALEALLEKKVLDHSDQDFTDGAHDTLEEIERLADKLSQ